MLHACTFKFYKYFVFETKTLDNLDQATWSLLQLRMFLNNLRSLVLVCSDENPQSGRE